MEESTCRVSPNPCSRATQVVSDPAKLPLSGLRATLFGWSSWRYYSIAHVGLKLVSRYWLGAHGSLPSLPTPPSPSTIIITSSSDSETTRKYGAFTIDHYLAIARDRRASRANETVTAPTTDDSREPIAVDHDETPGDVAVRSLTPEHVADDGLTSTAFSTPRESPALRLDDDDANTSEPAPPIPGRPTPRRDSTLSESIMTWIDTTAARGTERIFTS